MAENTERVDDAVPPEATALPTPEDDLVDDPE